MSLRHNLRYNNERKDGFYEKIEFKMQKYKK